jgi:hypothetical protein
MISAETEKKGGLKKEKKNECEEKRGKFGE